jgi:predicted acyltransferase
MHDVQPEPALIEKERLLSLDIFRGLMVIGMMLVDWPGSWEIRFQLFEHAEWLGITPPDFIFPAFMFIMGVAIPFSFQAKKIAGLAPVKIYLSIFRRSLLLFILGYFLNICWYSSPTVWPIDWSHMRLLGVLQRFAIVYPIVAMSYLHLSIKKLVYVGIGILGAYWAALTLIHVPGFGAPDLALYPQGDVAPNLATWFDKVFLKTLADNFPYDSEGILSNIPAIATTIIGVITGTWLRTGVSREEKVNRIFTWGVLLTISGYFWSLSFPLGKKLWTSSFVLFMGGWSLLLLGALFWAVDVKKKTSRFLAIPRWFGMNAISAIVLFTFIDNVMSRIPVGRNADQTVYALKDFLNDHLLRSWLSDKNASWAYSVLAILLLSLLFRWFHNRKWFFRV